MTRRRGRRAKPGKPGWVAEAVGAGFGRLTVAPAIIMIAWLIPGLPLLLAGDFLPVPVLLIAAPLATALAVNALHRVPGRWPVELPGSAADRRWTSWWALAGTVIVAVGFTAWQLILNSTSLIVSRTPGANFQTGYWIAQHGSLPITQSLTAFGNPAGLHLASTGFYQSGHAVIPAVTAGLPMLLTAGFWTSGIAGGAVIGPVIGGLAVLSFGGLVGRLIGRQWAPAGALALGVTLPEIFTSRDSFGETAIQVLLFGGFSLLIDALTLGRGARSTSARAAAGSKTDVAESMAGTASPEADGGADGASWETQPLPVLAGQQAPATAGRSPAQRVSRALRRVTTWPRAITWRDVISAARAALTPDRIGALLGGLSLGLTLLVSPGSLVLVVPAIPVAGVLIAARRAVGVAFCIGLVIGAGYGIAAGYLLARPLMDSLARALEVAGLTAAGLAVLTALVLRLLWWAKVRRPVRSALGRRPLRWLPALGAVVVVGGAAFGAVRPYLQTIRGRADGTTAHYVAALQRIEHLKIDPGRLYAEDTLYWVFWYVGIAALLLGVFGGAALVRRSLQSLLGWRDGSGSRLNWALPVAVLLGGSVAVLWQPHTVPDQPWASRRLVPAVIPMLVLFATWAAAWLTRRARQRGAGGATAVAVGVFCVGAMLLPSVSTSFGAGLTHTGTGGGLRPSAGGPAQHRVASGEAGAIKGLCASIGRSSSVVIVDWHVAQLFTQVIRGVCGVPVAWVPQGTAASVVDGVLSGIERAGRRPVVLGARQHQVAGFGGQPTQVLNLFTTQDSHELAQAPGAPWAARYVIWMAAGAVPNVGV